MSSQAHAAVLLLYSAPFLPLTHSSDLLDHVPCLSVRLHHKQFVGCSSDFKEPAGQQYLSFGGEPGWQRLECGCPWVGSVRSNKESRSDLLLFSFFYPSEGFSDLILLQPLLERSISAAERPGKGPETQVHSGQRSRAWNWLRVSLWQWNECLDGWHC